MKSRRAEKRLAAKEAAQAAMFPETDSQRRHRQQHHHHHRRKRSSAGGISLPTGEPSPLKQAQLVRQRKENTAALARASVDQQSIAGDDSGGQTMLEVEGRKGVRGDRFSSSRQARHIALQEVSKGIGKLSRSDSFSDWARCATFVIFERFILRAVTHVHIRINLRGAFFLSLQYTECGF